MIVVPSASVDGKQNSAYAIQKNNPEQSGLFFLIFYLASGI
jgi:hypothetical protein